MITILDYGIGNVASISNMLKKIGAKAIVTADMAAIKNAEKLILPGVGHFDYCMSQLKNAPFFELLQEKVINKKVPILGVCVGCQMLMEKSEEGSELGLGWIKGTVVRFNREMFNENLKVPHMDWADVYPRNNNSLYHKIDEPRFYFVHSYHLQCSEDSDITATASYGYEFPASVARDNIIGLQFHPEKSHKYGMQLYNNFVNNF